MVPEHNLESYETARESFDWDDVYAEADWDAPKSINVAHEVCDRQVAGGDRIALRQVGVDGESDSLTFEELAERTNRFADRVPRGTPEDGYRKDQANGTAGRRR